MPALGIADVASILKTIYPAGLPQEVMFKGSITLDQIPKDTEWAGDGTKIPIAWGDPQGRSALLPTAILNKTGSKYSAFTVVTANDYAVWGLTGRTIDATRNDRGAFIRALKAETAGAMRSLSRSAQHSLFRNGGGAIGQISAGSTVASTAITLANRFDAYFFEVGQVIQGSATDGTSGTVRAGAGVTVTGVNRRTGVITAAANWNVGITGAAVNDFLFMSGDFGAKFKGFDAWIPAADPTATLFEGVDRSVDPERLGGTRLDATLTVNRPIDENIMDLLEAVSTNGGETDILVVHPRQWTNLEKRLATRVRYGMRDQKEMKGGTRTIIYTGPKGDVDVVSDPNARIDTMLALQLDTWTLGSFGKLFKLLDNDNLPFLRVTNADEIEGQLVSRPGLGCEAPGWNGRCTLATTGL